MDHVELITGVGVVRFGVVPIGIQKVQGLPRCRFDLSIGAVSGALGGLGGTTLLENVDYPLERPDWQRL